MSNFGFIEDEIEESNNIVTNSISNKKKRGATRSSTFLKRSGDSNFKRNLENLLEKLEGKEKIMHLNVHSHEFQ